MGYVAWDDETHEGPPLGVDEERSNLSTLPGGTERRGGLTPSVLTDRRRS